MSGVGRLSRDVAAVDLLDQSSLLPQYRHRMAFFLMGSAQNGHGTMGASCAGLVGFGVAG